MHKNNSSRWVRQVKIWVLLSAVTVLPAFAQMTTPAQFQVNESGAATYTIPIQLPPGIGGMEPKLSLDYSSQAGNGLLGMGWGLSGLGGVSRCAQTIAQDGRSGSVNYDNNDRYCLDGQRLIAIAGTYGADGTEYRTERESFMKIVSYGTAGTGPQSFKAWTKSGQIIEYGGTADSRVEAQGTTTIRLWTLNSMEDTQGNYFTVGYAKDISDGDYYPLKVSYTGNNRSAQASHNAITFEYETRPDIAPKYSGGSVYGSQVRLVKIATSVDASAIEEYRLTYATAAVATPSILASITQCNAVSSKCLPPVNMTVPNATFQGWPSWTPKTAMEPLNISACKLLTMADVNGDGLDDMLCIYDYGNGQTMTVVRLSVGDGFTGWQAWSPETLTSDAFQPALCSLLTLADVNGDGLPDEVCVYEYEEGRTMVLVQTNTGDRFNGWQSWSPLTAPASMFARANCPLLTMADVNGDGRADIVCLYDYGDGRTTTTVQLSSGSAFSDWTAWNMQTVVGGFFPKTSCAMLAMADVNGDGLPDIVCVYDYGQGQSNTVVQLNAGNAFANWTAWGTETAVGGIFVKTSCPMLAMADVNGDGLPDVVCVYDYGQGQTNTAVQLNRGNAFSSWMAWGTETPIGSFNATSCRLLKMADVNGDGLADVICVYDYGLGATVTTVQLSTGSGFTPWMSKSPYLPAGNFYVTSCSLLTLADTNGDGAPDIVCLYDYGDGNAITWVAPSGPAVSYAPSQIASGSPSVAISYVPLSNHGIYTKDSGPNASPYPVVDVQSPLYVVTKVAASNGVGGVTTTSYTYGGLKSDLSGRGLLGFRWMQAKQVESGLASYSEFRQDWPYTGLQSLSKKTLAGGGNSGVLSQVTSSYGCNDPSSVTITPCTMGIGKRYFVYANQSTSSNWDLNGAAFSVTTTNTTYDNWGNATAVNVSTSDGFSKSTTNSFSNDSTNWLLGRLLRASVTSVSP